MQQGNYVPLETGGIRQDHIIAFARTYEQKVAIAIAPRFLTKIIQPGQFPFGQVWQDTYVLLPHKSDGLWTDAVTGKQIVGAEKVLLSQILSDHCVALLM